MRLYGGGPFHREFKTATKIRKKSHFVIKSGDVIYNKLFAWKGTFGVVPDELDGMFVSDKFPTYQHKPERVDLGYLRWYFRYPLLWEQARQMSTGSAALSKLTLNPPRFMDLTIPLPPVNEQRRLVERIEQLAARINEAHGLRELSLREASAYLPSHLDDLFGNPYEDVTGELGIQQFELLANVALDVADGPHKTPVYVDDGVPFITVLNITSGRIRFGNHKYVTAEAHDEYCRRAKAERGDVLISKDGTIGIPCFVDTERAFSFFVSVALVKPKRDVLDGEFLTWVFRAPYLQDRIRERSRGDMIRHLVLREIRALSIPLPSLDEQRRIVVHLDGLQAKVDRLNALQRKTAAELDALLPSILDKAFKGNL